MKKGTETKLKFRMLQDRFSLPLWQAVGLLETLWDFTAHNAPSGGIGRFTNQQIAIGIDWKGEPDELISALIETGWVDEHSSERLVVHDWSEHCEDSVHIQIARKKHLFCDGSAPRLTRLTQKERAPLVRYYKELAAKNLERSENASKRSENAQPNLTRPDLTKPNPAINARPAAGVFDDLTDADLSDTGRLVSWFDRASCAAKPVIAASEANLARVVCAAERAIEHGDKPVALFASIVSKAQWDFITAAQEDRAQKRLRRHRATGPPAPVEVAELVKGFTGESKRGRSQTDDDG